MFYKLNNIGLRSFADNQTAYFFRGGRDAYTISSSGFELLKRCDGKTDMPPSPALALLALEGLIEQCREGDAIEPWQSYRACPNPCFPALNWAITQRCNYNCRHCFMASDNIKSCEEFSWEECTKLICDMESCGVWRVSLTGGEPLAHRRFGDIVRELSARYIDIFEIATNGALLDSGVLKLLRACNQAPLIKISFDGLGYHDIMRSRQGAQEAAVAAIKLCREYGFAVRVQMNINKENLAVIPASLDFVEALGVEQTRLIRTSEAPRWEQVAPGASLGYREYFDEMLRIISEYVKSPHKMKLTLWQFSELDPVTKMYHNRPIKFCGRIADEKLPACPMNRLMLSITGAGELIPCNQMEGALTNAGVSLANVHTTSLKTLLCDEEIQRALLVTVGDIFRLNPDKCGVCRHRLLCGGGCAALALAFCGRATGFDPLKCAFFEGGYINKLAEIFSSQGWNTSDNIYADIKLH